MSAQSQSNTPSHPKANALRSMVPILPGSCTRSRIKYDPVGFFRIDCKSISSRPERKFQTHMMPSEALSDEIFLNALSPKITHSQLFLATQSKRRISASDISMSSLTNRYTGTHPFCSPSSNGFLPSVTNKAASSRFFLSFKA
jgi:hypothetical protein